MATRPFLFCSKLWRFTQRRGPKIRFRHFDSICCCRVEKRPAATPPFLLAAHPHQHSESATPLRLLPCYCEEKPRFEVIVKTWDRRRLLYCHVILNNPSPPPGSKFPCQPSSPLSLCHPLAESSHKVKRGRRGGTDEVRLARGGNWPAHLLKSPAGLS